MNPDTLTNNNIQGELDRIRDEALGIRDQLNQMGTKPEPNAQPEQDSPLPSPTFQTQPDFDELYPSIDENQVRDQTMSMFQQQIDATNEVYDQMLNDARMEGQGRLGSQRAMSARGGLLGSDFGASQKDNVLDQNRGIESQLQAERLRALGGITADINSQVTQQMQEKRLARQQGADNYIDYLSRGRERREENLNTAAQALLAQGIDPTTLDENELASIGQDAGLSARDIISRYSQLAREQEAATQEANLEQRMTEAEIAKIENDIAQGKILKLPEGNMLYDTETGETFKNPKTFAPRSGGGSGSDEESEGGTPLSFWERNQIERQDGIMPPSWMTREEYDRFMRDNAGLSPTALQRGLDNIRVNEDGTFDIDTAPDSSEVREMIDKARAAGHPEDEILERVKEMYGR